MRLLTTFLVLVCLLVGSTLPALAVPTLTISSSGNGVFVLQGNDFQAVGGVQLTIRYDTTTLTNPRVTKGALATAAAIFMPNTNNPGVIIMGMIDPNGVSGSGVLATINFDLPGSSPGVIQSLTADMIDSSSKKIASQVQVINPAAAPGSPGAPTGTASGSSTAPIISATPGVPFQAAPPPATATSPAPGLVLSTPSPVPAEAEKPMAQPILEPPAPPIPAGDLKPQPETAIEKAQPAGAPTAKSQPTHVVHQSVLERFRTFTGGRTPQSLTDIFTTHSMPGIRQEPAIGLADGVSKVRLTVTTQASRTAPNFSLQNARLVSLKMEESNAWLIELLPAKGAHTATLTMIHDGSETEIPLTVVPPFTGTPSLGRSGTLAEGDFRMFLSEHHDLNGDGKRDYLDDYIFTGNYLLRKGK
jgi:hypothetical protein